MSEPEERLRLLEAVLDAADRLADAGPVSEIVDRAPAECARALGLERCVLSRVDDGRLVAEAIHVADGDAAGTLAALRQAPVRLGYPLLEAEMLRRRRAAIVPAPEDENAVARHAFAPVMAWGEYLAAPVVLEGRVIGFLHGDGSRTFTDADRAALQRFAAAFADIFERAVLRRRLRIQRQELRQVASWADARTSELSDGAIDLAVERDAPGADEPAARGPGGGDAALRDLLTRRELDVLEHMVQGETNADIARALVVSEGTVKFHVKNILRKLHASNRAEATSRYLRLSLRHGEGEGQRSLP